MSPARPGEAPSVLVPVMGPEGISAALHVGRELSRLLRATPRLLYLSPQPAEPSAVARDLGLAREDLQGVTVEALSGDLRAEILREARLEGTRMIVLSPALGRGRAPGELGPVAVALLGEAPVPLVLVPAGAGGSDWTLGEVLLAHDGTPTTAMAVRRASQLARRAGAWVRVLHVATPAEAPAEPGSLATPRYLDQPQHEWPSWAQEFLERLSQLCQVDLDRLRLVLGHGQPGEEVLRVAHESRSDLVLLAWRGSPDPGRGETVRKVLAGSRCPVMIVRVPSGEEPE